METVKEAIRLFHTGGLVMYPLLLCSIFVVAIVFERWRYYRQNSYQPTDFMSVLSARLAVDDWESAVNLCEQTPGLTARVLAAGLRARNCVGTMREGFEGAMAWEAAQLRKYLGHLDTIVTLSPLLGLLGTVFGMIGSFSVLDVNANNPSAITGGVGEALVATAAGLSVAVLALVAHSYFSHRLDDLITDVEKSCAVVITQLKGDAA